jgi:bifunctional DNA-binding transcriptional regulator/antitoxin component of YhaV-PrlF toxin-antitoxin module
MEIPPNLSSRAFQTPAFGLYSGLKGYIMAHLVGPKGQVVIEKEIRDRLGVQPGWQAVQLLVDNHVRIYFIPPEHNRSLRGILQPFIQRQAPPEEQWDELIGESIADEFREKTAGE